MTAKYLDLVTYHLYLYATGIYSNQSIIVDIARICAQCGFNISKHNKGTLGGDVKEELIRIIVTLMTRAKVQKNCKFIKDIMSDLFYNEDDLPEKNLNLQCVNSLLKNIKQLYPYKFKIGVYPYILPLSRENDLPL